MSNIEIETARKAWCRTISLTPPSAHVNMGIETARKAWLAANALVRPILGEKANKEELSVRADEKAAFLAYRSVCDAVRAEIIPLIEAAAGGETGATRYGMHNTTAPGGLRDQGD